MTKATAIVRKAAVKADRIVDTVTLDHIARDNPPAHLAAAGGLHIDLHLPAEAQLNDGDALKLEDGGLVAVKAVDEKLLEVKAENPLRLMRVLWHLGQNHTPVEVTAEAVYVAQDDAVAELMRGQGCSLAPVDRPFRPERAIAGHDCGHDHHGHAHHGHQHHDHHAHDDHAHAHHDHEHKHEHAHHAHGACGCGHDHHDHAGDHHSHDDHGKDHHGKAHHGHAHDHEDDAAHGHRHHSHAHHGHDHGKDGH